MPAKKSAVQAKRTSTGRARPKKNSGAGDRRYAAYAVAANGSRKRIDACSIVVEVADGELEIGLVDRYPLVSGRLDVRVKSDGFLVLGPGDGNSVYLAIEPFGGSEV